MDYEITRVVREFLLRGHDCTTIRIGDATIVHDFKNYIVLVDSDEGEFDHNIIPDWYKDFKENSFSDIIPLNDCNIKDISPLLSLNILDLGNLDLSDNPIEDISTLFDMKNLIYIDLKNTKVPLKQLVKLKTKLPNCSIDNGLIHDWENFYART